MVGVLLDTNVLSEFTKPFPDQRVVETLRGLDSRRVYVSVFSLGELRKGLELLPPGAKREELRRFSERIERQYGRRLLDVDLDVAQIWGELTARGRKLGKPLNTTDGLIAATALRHGLHVMTRNVKDFEPTGVLLIDPWADDQ